MQGSDSTDENKRLRACERKNKHTPLSALWNTEAKQILFALYLMVKILTIIFTTWKEIQWSPFKDGKKNRLRRDKTPC